MSGSVSVHFPHLLMIRDCRRRSSRCTYSLPTEMQAEHCFMRGHDQEFDCLSHYEQRDNEQEISRTTPRTSAKQEWDAVVEGKEPQSLKHFRLRECYRKLSGGREVGVYLNFPPTHPCPLSHPERLGLALYTGPMVRRIRALLPSC